MQSFFSIIYIVANRFSDEKIAVALLANINGVPYFSVANRKLSFALQPFTPALRSAIRKGFKYMDVDVNKINRGEEALSLFDPPYSKRLLKELAHKKRGVVTYSEVYELTQSGKTTAVNFEALFKKFLGEVYSPKEISTKNTSYKQRFKEYISHKRFNGFDYNYKLSAGNTLLYIEICVSICAENPIIIQFFTQ